MVWLVFDYMKIESKPTTTQCFAMKCDSQSVRVPEDKDFGERAHSHTHTHTVDRPVVDDDDDLLYYVLQN